MTELDTDTIIKNLVEKVSAELDHTLHRGKFEPGTEMVPVNTYTHIIDALILDAFRVGILVGADPSDSAVSLCTRIARFPLEEVQIEEVQKNG